MTTYQRKSILSEVISGEKIPLRVLAYFRARLSNRIHSLMLEEFARLEESGKITRAELGRRIGREPAQITRWLGTAGNWTIETLSDLLLGMKCEPALSISNLANTQTRNETPKSSVVVSGSVVITPKIGSITIEPRQPATAIEAASPPKEPIAVGNEGSALAATKTGLAIIDAPAAGALSKTFGTRRERHPMEEKVAA